MVVGDRAKDVIVHLHYILSSVDIKQNKSVLWAYKKDLLGFTSHRKKRENKIRKEIKRGIREPNSEDPFELFLTLNNIRYVFYKETEKILGNTYGVCILQDFEAITPNLLARTIETVEGGGMVLLLLKGMKSLKQLYALTMDVHSRYRTEAHDDVVARFNERFVLSLGNCESCLFVDDELNVLPISGGKYVQALPPPESMEQTRTKTSKELQAVKESHADSPPLGKLIQIAKTIDQAKALVTFTEAIAEKTLRSTVTLTAARGRGKSAALGVAISAAVAHGYSNIFITSPSPENLKTLFEFVFKGFDALGYMDKLDYTIIQSTNPEFNKAIVRVNVHRQHRQTIQYIRPQDAYTLGQAELVVIDEAAAIPLPYVKQLMGPYLVFMASTINGYEGTGRSLSLKLIQQLRDQSRNVSKPNGAVQGEVVDRPTTNGATNSQGLGKMARTLREITLEEPIRYARSDAIEKWLNKVLCLDVTLPTSDLNVQGCPHPSKCELLCVNRDTLFSYHPVSEKFLQQMMALYVSSHYKNTPNDLQLMSDAPAHQLFVLVPPVDEGSNRLPEPLCVIQVALEGQISRNSVINGLNRGERAGGDLIPWLVSQQFQDEEFAGLSGARIVRVATSPEYGNQGYGSRALNLLVDFYEGKFTNLSEGDGAPHDQSIVRVTDVELENATLQTDDIRIRDIKSMPPLFARLSERRSSYLDYIGVSYGLTQPLHRFWKRLSFSPVYLRQTPNELTGEHTNIMVRALNSSNNSTSWLGSYSLDFQKRFHTLLSYQFRSFPAVLALSLLESAKAGAALDTSSLSSPLTKSDLDNIFSPFDLKRLDSYANNMLDYHVILDLIPQISMLYFSSRLTPPTTLTGVQSSILLAIGLQRKTFEDIEKELQLPVPQLLAMFVKTVRKIASHFRRVVEGAVVEKMPDKVPNHSGREGETVGDTNGNAPQNSFTPLKTSLNDELATAGQEYKVDEEVRAQQRALIDSLPLDRYSIDAGVADEERWQEAEQQVQKAHRSGKSDVTVTVKSDKKRKKERDGKDRSEDGGTAREIYEKEIEGPREKKLKKGISKNR